MKTVRNLQQRLRECIDKLFAFKEYAQNDKNLYTSISQNIEDAQDRYHELSESEKTIIKNKQDFAAKKKESRNNALKYIFSSIFKRK